MLQTAYESNNPGHHVGRNGTEPQQVAEVENFVEFLAAKAKKRAAIDRLLAYAPALEAAGIEPMSEDEIAAEVNASRAARCARQATKDAGADRS